MYSALNLISGIHKVQSVFSDFDRHLFAEGRHYRIFDKFGAHTMIKDGVKGVNFAVWAPNAGHVSVTGTFNNWDGRHHVMDVHEGSGIWELFVPGLCEGELYKYEIRTRNGKVFYKSDPYAFYTEIPPGTASIVYSLEGIHEWSDSEWMYRREMTDIRDRPVCIYEIHPGSFMKNCNNAYLTYRQLADELVPYVRDTGFTHIELMPVAEHPYAPSWGYQVSNFYAPTSRFGRPEELMYFVDRCHRNGIGVILDWVSGHFPRDDHALSYFDGTCLYEHQCQGIHPDWGTLTFDYASPGVENFLVANAVFWIEKYHLDGLRVDAVASMLYLDYSRRKGEWTPNRYGSNENLEAIEFIKHTNVVLHEKFPGIMICAEESSAWPAVSRPVAEDGLGFGFKWNMGWMHDVLLYMKKDAAQRRHHHNNLTFGLHYAFHENFILPLSHDEVVHEKGSIIQKMPGDRGKKFANLRLLYAFMYAHPGKKLLFMGNEFGQWREWDHEKGPEWHLLGVEEHRRLRRYIMKMNELYHKEKSLYELDFKDTGFEWIDADNTEESILAFMRKARDPRDCLFFVINFSDTTYRYYRLGVPYPGFYKEVLHSDSVRFGGSGMVFKKGRVAAEDLRSHGHEFSLVIPLPPLSAVMLKPFPPEQRSGYNCTPVSAVNDKQGHRKGGRSSVRRTRRRKKGISGR